MEGGNLMAVQAKAKNSGFNMKEASKEDIVGFKLSDTNEWKAMVDMGAVRMLDKSEADLVRKSFPHRVIASWMIRRKKPLPAWSGELQVQIKAVCAWPQGPRQRSAANIQSNASCFPNLRQSGLKVALADVTNAFCQADPLNRKHGKLYVQPCPGVDLESSSLAELVASVYGLDDAPRWHHTLIPFFTSLGFVRSPMLARQKRPRQNTRNGAH